MKSKGKHKGKMDSSKVYTMTAKQTHTTICLVSAAVDPQ